MFLPNGIDARIGIPRRFVQFNADLLDVKLSDDTSPGILNSVSQ